MWLLAFILPIIRLYLVGIKSSSVPAFQQVFPLTSFSQTEWTGCHSDWGCQRDGL
uniref:Uncharacterized protein n=1 Tax=Anguilla anguilla TaxID=7936 RepID=A0A0E9QR15_ANGAN